MNSFLKKHPDGILIAFTVVFVAVIAGAFLWGFLDLTVAINRVFNFSPTMVQRTGFDLKGAASLNLKGLVQEQQQPMQ
jgi:hypothetical protein